EESRWSFAYSNVEDEVETTDAIELFPVPRPRAGGECGREREHHGQGGGGANCTGQFVHVTNYTGTWVGFASVPQHMAVVALRTTACGRLCVMKIAVVGGTGLIGRQVVAGLRSSVAEVVSLSRGEGVDLITGDGLDEALEGVDTVIDVSNVNTIARKPA